MRRPKAMVGSVYLWSPRLLSGVGACFNIVGNSERLPSWTMRDVWSGTLRVSSMESVWRVDRIFSCKVYVTEPLRNEGSVFQDPDRVILDEARMHANTHRKHSKQ
jgi:hypothetical protein